MSQYDRDDLVARALDDLEVPDHGEGFFEELTARLSEPPVETVAPAAARGPVAANETAEAGVAGDGPVESAAAEAAAVVPLRRRRRGIIMAAAALAVAAGAAAYVLVSRPGPVPAPGPAATNPVAIARPILARHNVSWLFSDGSRLVWTTRNAGKSHLQVESLDLETGTRTSLKKLSPHLPAQGTGDLAMVGDRVAWIDQSGHSAKLYTSTLPGASPSPIGAPTRNFSSRGVVVPGKKGLRLSSLYAVWIDSKGGKTALWAYDFVRKTQKVVPGSEGIGDQYALGGSLLAWISTTDSGSAILAYDLQAAKSFSVPLPDGVTARDLAISGETIVWSDNRNATSPARDDNNDIYGYDVAAGRQFPICRAPGMQTKPAIDGDLVAWLDGRPTVAGGAAGPGNAIYGYLISLDKEFAISTDRAADGSVSVSGNRVIWTTHASGQASVFGATVTVSGDQVVVAPIKP
jgi:hypothetical protein